MAKVSYKVPLSSRESSTLYDATPQHKPYVMQPNRPVENATPWAGPAPPDGLGNRYTHRQTDIQPKIGISPPTFFVVYFGWWGFWVSGEGAVGGEGRLVGGAD